MVRKSCIISVRGYWGKKTIPVSVVHTNLSMAVYLSKADKSNEIHWSFCGGFILTYHSSNMETTLHLQFMLVFCFK